MQPADSFGGMSRQKARERIDTVLASMDTIRLYMTAAALWRSKNDTSLYQPDIRVYAECGRILAEDIHYEPQPATPDRDTRIDVVLESSIVSSGRLRSNTLTIFILMNLIQIAARSTRQNLLCLGLGLMMST